MALMACAIAIPVVDAAQSDDYVSQLDDNGLGLYGYVDGQLVVKDGVVPLSISIVYPIGTPVLFDDVASAKAYAESMVADALSALYLSDPYSVWLWDYPVKELGIDVVTTVVGGYSGSPATSYVAPTSVSFVLNVPEAYRDDPATEVDETLEALNAVDSATKTFEGTLYDKVRGINDILRGVDVTADGEGTIGNIHDALVKGASSTAGIAAAFTYLCEVNGIDALTVQGSVLDGDGFVQAYWNVVRDGESWLAVDCTWNSGDEKNCLLAGVSSDVSFEGAIHGYGSTHVADLSSIPADGLVAPQIAIDGYEWPDERGFVMKYGAHIAMAVITLLIVLAIVIAIRNDNV